MTRGNEKEDGMTEDEMKTKWCPHVSAGVCARERTEELNNIGRCIGSACSQWRWERQFMVIENKISVADLILGVAPEMLPPQETPPHHGSGYCGLAGRP